MQENNSTQKNELLKYGDIVRRKEKESYGRVGAELAHSVSYDRLPSLFDSKEMAERDAEILKDMQELDKKYCIDRRHKPIYLTHYQQRIVLALTYYITQPEELAKDDVKNKIANPYKSGLHVSRVIPIEFFTLLIFGDAKTRHKKCILRELYQLSRVRQYVKMGSKWISLPLINIGNAIEDDNIDANTIDAIEIIFGSKFFEKVDIHFSPIREKLFIEWRKKGRATELYGVLLNELLFVYPKYLSSLRKIQERIRKNKKNKNLQASEIDELIRNEIEYTRAMDFELTIEKLKKKVARDYDSNRANRRAFWNDLDNAIEGIKETGPIERVLPSLASKPTKLVFTFSQTYNESTNTTKVLEDMTKVNRPTT